MNEGGGTPVLAANQRWLGPGGESLYVSRNKSDPVLMVFHAYDAKTGKPALQVSTVAWKDGWPKVAMEGDQPAASK